MAGYFQVIVAQLSGSAGVAAAAAGSALFVIVAGWVILSRRQRIALARLDERMTHLAAGVSLLTNTTEDGLRGVALEIVRLAGAAGSKPRAQATTRNRIATAAGHGRSVQDIAASEQVSEGEVLLHLLLDKIRPEGSNAEVC